MIKDEIFQEFTHWLNEPSVQEISVCLQDENITVQKSEIKYRLLDMKANNLKGWFDKFIDELFDLYKEYAGDSLSNCSWFLKVKHYEY